MVLVIDNYDSFTYNLVQYLGEVKKNINIEVYRNDRILIEDIVQKKPSHIIISPGPGRPENAGISNNIFKYFKKKIPILGVCLGHQCLGQVFGARIIEAEKIYHGKTSEIYIKNSNMLFKDIENPFIATRYHSLIIDPDSIPDSLNIIAETKEKEIMAIKHKKYSLYGVQFHPESILTESGKKILKNFLKIREV